MASYDVLLRRCSRLLAQELFRTHTAVQCEVDIVERAFRCTIRALVSSHDLLLVSGLKMTPNDMLCATAHRIAIELAHAGITVQERTLQRIPLIIAHTICQKK